MPNKPNRILYNSPEYNKAYKEGTLYSEDEEGNLMGAMLPEVVVSDKRKGYLEDFDKALLNVQKKGLEGMLKIGDIFTALTSYPTEAFMDEDKRNWNRATPVSWRDDFNINKNYPLNTQTRDLSDVWGSGEYDKDGYIRSKDTSGAIKNALLGLLSLDMLMPAAKGQKVASSINKLDDIGKFLSHPNWSSKNIPQKLSNIKNTYAEVHKTMQPYKTIPKSEAENISNYYINSGNKWSEDWYNHPEFANRLENFRGDINEEISEAFKMFNGDLHEKKLTGIVNDIFKHYKTGPIEIIKQRIKDKKYVSKLANEAEQQAVFSGDQLNFLGDSKGSIDPNTIKNYVSRALIPDASDTETNILGELMRRIGIHEGNHGITLGNLAIPNELRKRLKNAFFAADNTNSKYFLTPTEIYARLMELRQNFNVKPGQILSTENIHKMREAIRNGYTSIDPEFDSYIIDDEVFKKLMNDIPALTGVGLGLYGANSYNKDNRKGI